jgi:hypothetical protein
MWTGNFADIKVPWEVDLGLDNNTFRLSLSDIAEDDCDNNQYPGGTKEHKGSHLVCGNVPDGGNQEHEAEESRNDCDDSEENCNAGQGSHMGKCASFHLLSFRVIAF